MVTKSKNSSSTLMYLLDGKIGQGFYDEISDNVKKGYYWGNKDLKVGDIIFIGNMYDGGRFAKIIKCDKLWVSYNGKWTRKYGYEPLDETLNGNDRPYITEKTMTTKQKLLRFFGFFNEFQIQTEI